MQQFTQWIMIRPELLREKMKEQKDTEQTTWVCIASFTIFTLSNSLGSESNRTAGIAKTVPTTFLTTTEYIGYQKPLRAKKLPVPSLLASLDVRANDDEYPKRSTMILLSSVMGPRRTWKIAI